MFLAIDFVLVLFFIGIVQTGGFKLGFDPPTIFLAGLLLCIHISAFMQGKLSVLEQQEHDK